MLDGALQDGFVEVMTAALAGSAIGVDSGRRKDPLPRPFAAGASVLFDEGVGEGYMARSAPQVPLVLGVDAFDMNGQAFADCVRQERDPVFASFARSDDHLTSVEIDILDAQVRALEKPQACAVEKHCHEPWGALELGEERSDFTNVHHYGECLRAFRSDQVFEWTEIRFQDVAIEEDQGREGLVLCGGADVLVRGERGEKSGNLGRSHFVWMTLVVEEDESCDPCPIGLFGSRAEMTKSDCARNPVAEFCSESRRRFAHAFGWTGSIHLILVSRHSSLIAGRGRVGI